jgi:hypothetical protein
MVRAADQYGEWRAAPEFESELDAVSIRDMLVECFFEAQKEVFARTKNKMGTSADKDALRTSARGAVRSAIGRVGGSYDEPTIESLQQAMEVLGSKARTWGTPDDVIERHMSEMNRVMTRAQQ